MLAVFEELTMFVGQNPGRPAWSGSGVKEEIHGERTSGPGPPVAEHPGVFGPVAQPHQLSAAVNDPVELLPIPPEVTPPRLF
jgi:hypothetical protein